MKRSCSLGELQLAIMRVLWRAGEATVAQVHAALEPERSRALTTIATMLSKLERKGAVAHRTDGRQFVYRPLVSEAEVQRSMVAELTDSLFGGDVAALVSHLLTEQEIERSELETLRQLIADNEDELGPEED